MVAIQAIILIGPYPTKLAAKVTRVTTPTLENWNVRGILVPSIATEPKAPRMYAFQDLVAIRVLTALRDSGIDPRDLSRVVEYLRKRKGLATGAVPASTVLITNGHDVYEQVPLNGTITMPGLQEPGQVVFHVVAFGSLIAEVARDARAALKQLAKRAA